MDYAFKWIVKNGGIDSEFQYPYTGEGLRCNRFKLQMRVASIDGFEDVPPGDEKELEKAVSQQPVSIAIEADTKSFQLYAGGVYDSKECGESVDHGVLVVGYGFDKTPKESATHHKKHHKHYWKVKILGARNGVRVDSFAWLAESAPRLDSAGSRRLQAFRPRTKTIVRSQRDV